MAAERIPFNMPWLTGYELRNVASALQSGNWAGAGPFTARCEELLQGRYRLPRCLLTTSCTHALEMAALLLGIKPGDEVVVPSYTFVSTASAFALRGATLRYADSGERNPNLDPAHVEKLLTPKTRCIVVVHYAGVACDMDAIMGMARAAGVEVVEDAAQAIDASHAGRALGTLGRFGTLSFHGTKNIAAGEAGALLLNRAEDVARAERVREKGTNRSAFVRGEVDKYGWVELGSSYVPSDLLAAILLAQLEALEDIQRRRRAVWDAYHAAFEDLESRHGVMRPFIPAYATNNAHMYYLVCRAPEHRDGLLEHLRAAGIQAAFHYTPLHSSGYQVRGGVAEHLPNADRFHSQLIRLPLYAGLTDEHIARVVHNVESFFRRLGATR